MIINHSIILEKYRCNKAITRYLLSLGFPVLSYDEKYFYFANTENLQKSLKCMPLHLKIMVGLSGGKEVKCDKQD